MSGRAQFGSSVVVLDKRPPDDHHAARREPSDRCPLLPAAAVEQSISGKDSLVTRGRTGIPVTIIYKADQTGALHPTGAYAVNGQVYDEIVTLWANLVSASSAPPRFRRLGLHNPSSIR